MINTGKRAEYSRKSRKIGDKAEDYLDYLFGEFFPKYGCRHECYKKSRFHPWDFAVFNGSNKRPRMIIESESKWIGYEEHFHKGIDFIYRKPYKAYPAKCYYFMPVGNKGYYSYIFWISMEDLIKYGHHHEKPTKRTNYTELESFIRISPEYLNKVSPSIKEKK